MEPPVANEFLTSFDRIYVINLEERTDRRDEMRDELTRLGVDPDDQRVTFFKAVKPDGADEFPSIGARGCFLSHLGVLRDAHERALEKFLILEDDAAFAAKNMERLGAVFADLEKLDWSIAYLGHRIDAASERSPIAGHHWSNLPADIRVETTHAMVIHQKTVAPIIAYFERMLARPGGHPDGGPMHVDGAYSWFRRDNPDYTTVVVPEPYVLQRASKSDIAQGSWKDHLPFIELLRKIRNRIS